MNKTRSWFGIALIFCISNILVIWFDNTKDSETRCHWQSKPNDNDPTFGLIWVKHWHSHSGMRVGVERRQNNMMMMVDQKRRNDKTAPLNHLDVTTTTIIIIHWIGENFAKNWDNWNEKRNSIIYHCSCSRILSRGPWILPHANQTNFEDVVLRLFLKFTHTKYRENIFFKMILAQNICYACMKTQSTWFNSQNSYNSFENKAKICTFMFFMHM